MVSPSVTEKIELTVRNKILNFVTGQIGKPFKTGAERDTSDPQEFDCSGLVQLSYKHAGLDCPNNVIEQFSFFLDTKEPLPGDVGFCSSKDGAVTHVIMKIGGACCIESVAGVAFGDGRKRGSVRYVSSEFYENKSGWAGWKMHPDLRG